MNLRSRVETLYPWALRPTIRAPVYRPDTSREIAAFLPSAQVEITPRGAGTAYGDICVNPCGSHLSLLRLDKFLEFDKEQGILTCQGGVTLNEVINLVLPQGWFPAVSPGTAQSTVGGCMACDAHGKNHHIRGSFAMTVKGMKLLTSDGQTHECSPEQEADLFWATAGGLGQTGVITQLTIQLAKVESSWIKTRNIPTRDLEETLALIDEHADATYSVSWIDSLARGRHMGRGIIMLGEHATMEDLLRQNPTLCDRPFELRKATSLFLPFFPPPWASNTFALRFFNAVYYRAHSRSSQTRLTNYRSFFYPLDSVKSWNRIYGRRGFIEYQVAVPLRNGREICLEICETLSRTGNGSFLAVIKRMGPGNPGPMSFPIEGYTLAIDMRAGWDEQAKILDGLDRLVAEAGGRVYLVKDSRVDSRWIDTMYPRRREWAEFVARHDPRGLFSSNLVHRLNLR